MHSQIWNARTYPNRIDFSFALVDGKVADSRNSIIALLRERGWLVHGTNASEEALRLLAHIPYNLIVVDSELPGMGAGYMNAFFAREFWRFVLVQQRVAKLAQTAVEFPPMQAPASFNLDAVKRAIEEKSKQPEGE